MAERKYEVPDQFLAADRFGPLANELSEQVAPGQGACVTPFATARCTAATWITGGEQPGQSIDQWAAYTRNQYATMFREEPKQIEPASRAAQGCEPQ